MEKHSKESVNIEPDLERYYAHQEIWYSATNYFATALWSVIGALNFISIGGDYQKPLYLFFSVTFLATIFLGITASRSKIYAPNLNRSVTLAATSGFAAICYHLELAGQTPENVLKINIILQSTLSFIVLEPRFRADNRFSLFFRAAMITAVLCGLMNSPLLSQVYFNTIFFFIGTVLIRQVVARSIREICNSTYQLEKIRLELHTAGWNRELELAKMIQSSIAVPAVIERSGLEIKTYTSNLTEIGGDWVGIHFQNNHCYILVVDAAGKGVQAALVVHAIQALWAREKQESHFDPQRWLGSVNQTLVNLGERTVHMATIGLVEVAGRRITYWRSGHTPLFVQSGTDHPQYTTLMGAGNPLGVNPLFDLKSATCELEYSRDCILVLGSDGVFSRDGIYHFRQIPELLQGLDQQGADYLLTFPSKDERTIVVVKIPKASEAERSQRASA